MAPNEQRLDVGPPAVLFSMGAAGFLARFLHSNTTRSLHCLWQFIPQSVDKTPWSGSLFFSRVSKPHSCSALVTHACPSLELGHLLFLMNLVVFSFDQLWISQSCCSPYHESQNQKQHPLSWREGCLSHPAYTAYFTETP